MPINSQKQQALQTVLSEWPLWGISGTRTPEIITQFRQGRSNDSYLLRIATEHYVLRMRRVNHGQTQNTGNENLIQHSVAQLDLAPRVVYESPTRGYRLCSYVRGTTLGDNAWLNAQDLSHLCRSIMKYQQLPLDLPDLSYTQLLEQYWEQAQPAINNGRQVELTARYENLHKTCIEYEKCSGGVRSLCHHDLNAHNIVRCEPASATDPVFKLLDWEFAGNGIASMDFGALSVELHIPLETLAPIVNISNHELDTAANIYRLICELYNIASSV